MQVRHKEDPLRIVGEVEGRDGHAPEVLRAMLDNLVTCGDKAWRSSRTSRAIGDTPEDERPS